MFVLIKTIYRIEKVSEEKLSETGVSSMEYERAAQAKARFGLILMDQPISVSLPCRLNDVLPKTEYLKTKWLNGLKLPCSLWWF